MALHDLATPKAALDLRSSSSARNDPAVATKSARWGSWCGQPTYYVLVTGNAPPDDGGTDWRRLADERNIPLAVARALWERAWAAASGDPVQAEHAFLLLLDDAEAANITQEPGRGTLADSSAGARDASSLGPGKWTRVLIEQPKPTLPALRAEAGERPSAEQLRNEIVAADQAVKHAAAMLAGSDPATIMEALRELSGGEGAAVLKKVVNMAGGVVARILAQRPKTAAAPPGSAAAEGAAAEGAVAEGAAAEGVADEGAADEGAAAEGAVVEAATSGDPAAPGTAHAAADLSDGDPAAPSTAHTTADPSDGAGPAAERSR